MMDHAKLTQLFSRGVLIFIWSFLVAVVVSSFISVSYVFSLFFFILSLLILGGEKLYKGKLEFEIILVSIFLSGFALGIWRYEFKDNHESIEPTFTGIIVSEPEQKENTTRFVFRSENGEKVQVSSGLYTQIAYGDEVKLEGKLKQPEIIDDGSGRPFDYAAYLSKDDIYYVMDFAKVTTLSSGNGNRVKAFLYRTKNNFVEKIREILPEPESSLLAGLIVAGKASMPKNILEEFRRAGVIHIVVLSGYNITIVAEFIRRFFQKILLTKRINVLVDPNHLPKLAASLSLLGILLFVLMTGAEATVVRAALMVLVVILAKLLGRDYSASRALLVAGFLMILENPKILLFDPSFQLSFLATCGLIYISPIMDKFLEKLRMGEGELRSTLATTIATQITVLPLLIYSVGDVSIVSLPANLLILLLIPYTMGIGFLATLIAYVSPVIALPLSYIAHLMLAWIIWVSHFLGNLSFATINIPLPAWLVIIVYFLIVLLIKPNSLLRNFLRKFAS